MTSIVLMATHNQGKRREYEQMLGDVLPQGWTYQDLGSWPEELPEVIEDRETFVGNAIKKALESAQAAGVPALAEDSGLCVDALGGAPGVYSARFAGTHGDNEANNDLLLERLEGVPDAERTARYVALTCLALPDTPSGHELLGLMGHAWGDLEDGEPEVEGEVRLVQGYALVWWRGAVEGVIGHERRGTGGFGYDPLFNVKQYDRRMAEITPEQKNAISHRAEALGKMRAAFRS